MAGLAGLYRLGDPLCVRLSGVVINQPDLPWWATGILGWIARVEAMQQATGDLGKIYREMVKQVLEEGTPTELVNERTGKITWLSGPAAIYGLYQEYTRRRDAES